MFDITDAITVLKESTYGFQLASVTVYLASLCVVIYFLLVQILPATQDTRNLIAAIIGWIALLWGIIFTCTNFVAFVM